MPGTSVFRGTTSGAGKENSAELFNFAAVRKFSERFS